MQLVAQQPVTVRRQLIVDVSSSSNDGFWASEIFRSISSNMDTLTRELARGAVAARDGAAADMREGRRQRRFLRIGDLEVDFFEHEYLSLAVVNTGTALASAVRAWVFAVVTGTHLLEIDAVCARYCGRSENVPVFARNVQTFTLRAASST